MTTTAVESSKHGTLAPGVMDVVTLNFDFPQVEILNRNGAAEIFYTVDGDDPTVNGDNTYVLPAIIASQTVGSPTTGHSVVKLISAGAATYSVSGVGR